MTYRCCLLLVSGDDTDEGEESSKRVWYFLLVTQDDLKTFILLVTTTDAQTVVQTEKDWVQICRLAMSRSHRISQLNPIVDGSKPSIDLTGDWS